MYFKITIAFAISLVALAAFAGSSLAADSPVTVIENSRLRCEMDLGGLKMTRLVNKMAGGEMLRGPSRLIVLDIQGKVLDNADFRLESAESAPTPDGTMLRTQWKNATLLVSLHLECRLPKDSQEMVLRWSLRSERTEPITLAVAAPVLEHVLIGENAAENYLFFPYESGWCGKTAAHISANYGHSLWMQLVSAFDPNIGAGVFAYVRNEKGTPERITAIKRDVEGQELPLLDFGVGYMSEDHGNIFDKSAGTSLAFRHLSHRLEPGQTVELPNAVVGVSQGDWRDSFHHYKRWVRSWWKQRLTPPRWFMDNYAYISRHPDGFWDDEHKKYLYAENMTDTEVGALTEWFGWWDIVRGGDTTSNFQNKEMWHGDYDYPAKRGGLPALKEEIRRIHEKGGRIQLYTIFSGLWHETRVGRAHGAEWGRKDVGGDYNYDWCPPGEGYNACALTTGWQDFLSQRMETVMRETGADAYRLDVAAFIMPCFNAEHAHFDGTFRSTVKPEGMREFLCKNADAGRRANPEAALMVENAGSEYMAQFYDGCLTQAVRGTSLLKPYRGMNAYSLVFLRFLLPEVKILMFDTTRDDAPPMIFFNGIGEDRGGQGDAVRAKVACHRVMAENGDAINGPNPEPLVPTFQRELLANKFPAAHKTLWTLYNRNKERLSGDLIAAPTKPDTHYVELLHDVALKTRSDADKTVLVGDIEPGEVVGVAELPRLLDASLENGNLSVRIARPEPAMKVLTFQGDDHPSKAVELSLENGIGSMNVDGSGKVIVKLSKDGYLVDEIVLSKEQ